MTKNDDIIDLGGLWQSIDHQASAAAPKKPLLQRQRRLYWTLVLEMTIAAGGTAIGVAVLAKGDPITGLAAIIFSVVAGLAGWVSRKRHLAALEQSISQHLQSRLAVLRAEWLQHTAGLTVLVAALGFHAVVQSQRLSSSATISWAVWSVLIALAAVYAWRAKSAHKRYQRARDSHQAWLEGS